MPRTTDQYALGDIVVEAQRRKSDTSECVEDLPNTPKIVVMVQQTLPGQHGVKQGFKIHDCDAVGFCLGI